MENKKKKIYFITFNYWGKDGDLGIDIDSYTTKKEAMRQAKILRWNGHANVRVHLTTLKEK